MDNGNIKITYNENKPGVVSKYNNKTFTKNTIYTDGSQCNYNTLSGIEELIPSLSCEFKIDTESMAEVTSREDNTIMIT